MNLKSLAQSSCSILVASLLVTVLPAAQHAIAATDPSQIFFNSDTCELSTAGYTGSGAENDPYRISDSDALWEVADCSFTNSAPAHFSLIAPIDIRDAALAPTSSPIGLSSSGAIVPFRGILDGNNFSIQNISISSSTTGVGLFAQLQNAMVRSLSLDGSLETTSSLTYTHSAGAVAAWSEGEVSISDVVISASVTAVWNAGGIIGWADGPIELIRAENHGAVSGNIQIGGLIGFSRNHVTISNSVNHGEISAADYEVGGFIGFANVTAHFESSDNRGRVTANSGYAAGGIVGFAQGPVSMHNMRNHAPISANESAGGLVGYVVEPLTIQASENLSSVSVTTTYSGGLVGLSVGDVTVGDSTNSGQISANSSAAGLVGFCDSIATIRNSQNHGRVTGTGGNAAGLVGRCDGRVSVDNSVNVAPISGAYGGAGLVGQALDGVIITDSENRGAVLGLEYVGGLVGDGWVIAEIANSTNSGEISSLDYVGGLVGWSSAVSMSAVVNLGDVNARDYVGGIVGFTAESSTLSNFVNRGVIVGNDWVSGGIGGAIEWGSGQILSISSSKNEGQIFGNDYVGGLIGTTDEAFSIAIDTSSNTGNVTATGIWTGGLVGRGLQLTEIHESFNLANVTGLDDVGGLIGWSSASAIVRSFNTGDISASMSEVANRRESAGGLIGNARKAIYIESSFNTGDITALEAAGGLVGVAFEDVLINEGYSVAVLTTGLAGTTDGFIGQADSPGAVSLVSVTSAQSSRFNSAISVDEMRTQRAFQGWNFSSVWGFGTCQENQGLPMLRFANQVTEYYSTGCYGQSIAPNPSNQNSNTTVQPSKFPRFDQLKISGQPGATVSLRGEDLDLMISARIDGKLATLSSISQFTASLALPDLSPGIYDLELATSNGILTYLGLVQIDTRTDVSKTPTEQNKVRTLKVNPQSSWLTPTEMAQLAQFNLGPSTVTCIAYNQKPGLVFRKKALSRARHACKAAQEAGIVVKLFVYGKAPWLANTLKVKSR